MRFRVAHGRRPKHKGTDTSFEDADGEVLDKDTSKSEIEAVRMFNETVAHEAALHSIIVPIGDGLMVAIKL